METNIGIERKKKYTATNEYTNNVHRMKRIKKKKTVRQHDVFQSFEMNFKQSNHRLSGVQQKKG